MRDIKWYIKYFKYLTRHKILVAKACFRMWLYRRGVVHDLSKYLPSEYKYYMRYYSLWDETVKAEFDIAWNKHQNRNKHHWQYWILIEDNWSIKPLEMPKEYIKEMLCDWWACGYNFSKDKNKFNYCQWHEVYAWFNKNKKTYKKHMHINTYNSVKYFLINKREDTRLDAWMNWWYWYFDEIYPENKDTLNTK